LQLKTGQGNSELTNICHFDGDDAASCVALALKLTLTALRMRCCIWVMVHQHLLVLSGVVWGSPILTEWWSAQLRGEAREPLTSKRAGDRVVRGEVHFDCR